MKKNAIIAVLFLLIGVCTAWAGSLQYTNPALYSAGTPIQFYAPDNSGQALTVAGTTVDLTNYVLYAVQAGASGTCYYRPMTANTTAAKVASAQILVPASTVQIRGKNSTAPFMNVSGCVGGYFTKQ